jgi:hypothetical protein
MRLISKLRALLKSSIEVNLQVFRVYREFSVNNRDSF